MSEVCLWKPAIYELKILDGGKFEYCKSMGVTKFLKFIGGEAKMGDYDF